MTNEQCKAICTAILLNSTYYNETSAQKIVSIVEEECLKEKPKVAYAPATWIKASEKQPADGVLVVVKTKDGATYFGSAYKGKLMSNVEYWYQLPEQV